MEAVIVFGLSSIPSFSWLLFVRSANEAKETLNFSDHLIFSLNAARWNAAHNEDADNKKSFHQLHQSES